MIFFVCRDPVDDSDRPPPEKIQASEVILLILPLSFGCLLNFMEGLGVFQGKYMCNLMSDSVLKKKLRAILPFKPS